MSQLFQNSVFMGVLITFLSYELGLILNKKFRTSLFNPLLIAIIITSALLLLFNVDYDVYYSKSHYISFLLTPATVALAIPLYEQFELLKKNCFAILIGIITGVVTSLTSILILSYIFHIDHNTYVTLLPKSITTAIGIGVSEELGGYSSITVAIIIITGVLGNMCANGVCKLFGITNPIAKGIAIGTSSHAIGTSRAMEMGEVEGAMSSLSIVISGILTVIGANIYSHFL